VASPSRRRPAATVASSRRARLRAKASRIATSGDAVAPILTRSLTKTYGDLVAVDSLDLEISAGEIFGLLGQNGAGKTTTILMLLGLTEPTSGKARVVGLDPARCACSVSTRRDSRSRSSAASATCRTAWASTAA
jgi:ABC-type uncharacterized transport system ATPase subunit